MASDNINIDQFFRQKAEDVNADNSAVEQHWKQMQALLKPAVPASVNAAKLYRLISKKMLMLFAAVAITGAVLFVLFSKNSTPEKNISATIAAVQQQEDTSKKKMILVADTGKKTIDIQAIPMQADTGRKPIRIQLKAVNSNKDTVTIWANQVVNQVTQNQPAAVNSIARFYDQMQKPVQEFIIDAARGGSITGKEGTIINIPPAAFTDGKGNMVNGTIKINVEEFYKYSDMVAANLSTMSNGQQLVTGGMIKLTATQNGNDVALRADKAIGLSMPAKNYDAAMRLFTAAGEGGKMQYAPGMDTPVDVSYNTAVSGRKINWQLSAGQYGQTGFDNKTNFMSIQVEPSATRGTAYPIEEVLQRKNMEKMDSTFYAANINNDSIRFYSQLYATNNVSLTINGLNGKGNADTIRLRLAEQQRTAMAYSFQVKNMGWINCDRFYKYENKTDFVIHLPADVRADKFVTQIVFTSIRSVMPGQLYQNKIGFMNVPVNMPVYIIGLGERNGKVVSFMQSLITGTNEVFINTLQETTPQAFRQQLQQLDL